MSGFSFNFASDDIEAGELPDAPPEAPPEHEASNFATPGEHEAADMNTESTGRDAVPVIKHDLESLVSRVPPLFCLTPPPPEPH